MERGESISTTGFIVVSLGSLFVGLLIGAWINYKPSKQTKEYPVRVYLYGEQLQSYFDCDSANLNYAWKDGVKIQLKNVYQIKFN